MNIKSLVNAVILVVVISNVSAADPTDSLVNIVVWDSISGGNDHTYAVLKMTQNWTEANAVAPTLMQGADNGYLATITTQEENDFILNSVITGAGNQPSVLNQFYLGAFWISGSWTWQTGEPFSFENWSPTEPNNVGTETVIAIWGFGETDPRRPAGTWNNTLPDDSFNRFAIQWSIIEWDTPAVAPPPPPPSTIPTLSEWGMIILSLLMFGWMTWVIIKRRTKVPVKY